MAPVTVRFSLHLLADLTIPHLLSKSWIEIHKVKHLSLQWKSCEESPITELSSPQAPYWALKFSFSLRRAPTVPQF